MRLVFDRYLATRSLSRVALRLNTLGHRQKLRGERGGRAWDKYAIQRILRNAIYVGLVRDGDDLHPGEHPALVTREVFDEANASLESRTTGHGPRTSRKSEFLLTGLLSCGPCGRAMTSSTGRGRNGTRYRFYRCTAHNEGHKCPSGFVSAPTIEALVLEELRRVALGGDLKRLVEEDVRSKSGLRRDLEEERVAQAERVARLRADARRLLDQFRGVESGGKLVTARLGELEREVEEAEAKVAEVEGQLRALSFAAREGAWLTELLERFDPVWQALLPPERRELLFLLVERATVSGGEVQLVLRGTAG